MKNLDFMAVGDIVTDAFIRLKDAHVHCNLDREGCELCVRFGDKIPYEFVEVVPAVGNSPNAAVAAARLGLNAGLVSDIGDDENGKDCLAALNREKVDASCLSVHKGMKSNYHYVLWYEAERTILVKHEEYPRRFPETAAPRFLYLSSLGPNAENYHGEIADYLKKNPEVKLAFQPGTFQINLGAKLSEFYRRAEVFFCNSDEAKKITGNNGGSLKELLAAVLSLGPKTAVITDGPRGAYFSDGKDSYFMPPFPDPKPPFERTGAGDAFSSTFTAALAFGLSSFEAAKWAPVNSMSVVQKIGAQKGLLSRSEIEKYLKTAPSDYAPRKI